MYTRRVDNGIEFLDSLLSIARDTAIFCAAAIKERPVWSITGAISCLALGWACGG